MATFTTRLKTLIDAEFDLGLGTDDYPIFDEAYRSGLNRKILDHYANFEIGLETESMFKFALNRKMREIMPYYNQLYLSAQIEFDPLQTMNYTDESNTSNTQNDTATNTESSNGTATSDTVGKSRSVTSTTPQVQLSGNEDYASSAADVNSDTNVSGTTAGNSSQNSTHNGAGSGTIDRTVKGSQGPASDLLMRYRATFLNIDMQVIHDLATLFMQVWDNGDEFSNGSSVLNWGFGYDFGIL